MSALRALVTGEAIEINRLVFIDAATGTVKKTTAATDYPAGIATVPLASGDKCEGVVPLTPEVARKVKLVTGQNPDVGDFLIPAADGEATEGAPPSAGDYVIGVVSMAAAASGGTCRFLPHVSYFGA